MLRRHHNTIDEKSKDNSDSETPISKKIISTSKTSARGDNENDENSYGWHCPFRLWMLRILGHFLRPRGLILLAIVASYTLDVLALLQSPSIWYESRIVYPWHRMFAIPNPSSSLAGSLSTRRQVLDMLAAYYGNDNKYMFEREDFWVERHLKLQRRDITIAKKYNLSTTNVATKKTMLLLWSGTYPAWNAKINFTSGVDKKCNLPCQWTTDRNYQSKHPGSIIHGIVCMLYDVENGRCRDISQSFFGTAENMNSTKINGKAGRQIPILGVTGENDWKWQSHRVHLEEMPRQQLTNLQQNVEYNLIASHELDSHIPIPYPQIASLVSRHKIQTIENITMRVAQQLPEVKFAISNCRAPIRPDRLGLLQALQNTKDNKILLASFGKCLGNPKNYHKPWNARDLYGSKEHKAAMSKYMFVYAPENSFGVDYVTEKIYLPLLAGSVPIYMVSKKQVC